MRALGTGTTAWLLSSALLFSCPLIANQAQASQYNGYAKLAPVHLHQISMSASLAPNARFSHTIRVIGKRSATRSYGGISCVPYAREISGIMVVGNAWEWWYKAAGEYARGDQPEVGSVLNFRANGRMRLGHVAVVTRVINPREVIVDHANWPSDAARGGISHNVAVVDVSEANNWSAVRVELGRDAKFGSVYPTYGFIYNRPDTGMVMASVSRPAPQPDINPVPSDLRPAAERPWHTMEEVAESPSGPIQRIDLRVPSAAADPGR